MTTNQAPQSPTLDDLRRLAPTPIAQSIAAAFGPGQPSERFDAQMALLEGIAERACQLLNSIYLHSARDLGVGASPQLEQRLMALGRKNLSFGDHVGAIESFLSTLSPAVLHPAVASRWTELAGPLREQVAVGREIAALENLRNIREKYAIPVERVDVYLDDHPGSTPRDPALAPVLRAATTYRNARAHHHPWFSDDEPWYLLLSTRWRVIVERVLLHPPVYRLLTGVEVVSTRAIGRMTAPDQHVYDAVRLDLDGLRRPLGESKLSSSTHLAAGRYWARRPEDESQPLQHLFPARNFPENVESAEQREQRYRFRVYIAYLGHGALRASDIDGTLRALGAELGIEEKQARGIEATTVKAIRATEAELRAGERRGALAQLSALVCPAGEEDVAVEPLLAALDAQRALRIYTLIEDQWPISHSALQSHSEMHPEDLDRALQQLLAGAEPSKTIRQVEPAPGKVQYRIPSPRATEQLKSALDRLRAQPESIPPLRPLLEVCQQFFLDDGHPALPAAIGQLLVEARQPVDAPAVSHNESYEVATPRLLFAARGQRIAVSTVPELLREIVSRFGTDPALLARVPFASGKRRYVVAREPRHVAGHDFIAPLPFAASGIYFEANQSRFSALKSVSQWFTAAGIPVEHAEVDGVSIDELAARAAAGLEAGATSADDLVLHLRFQGRTEMVAGSTAGIFLGEVVQALVSMGRLIDEDLPVAIGRVRYLVAATPTHANGRPFDSPVESEGMFIESALTRKDARAHAAALCRKVQVEVLDADVEVD
ncbi:MAG: hypothetical protein ABJE95_25100 [Byssovorax sp.]